MFDDRPTFDFKVAHHNGSQFLTFIAGEDLNESDSPAGSGVILDSSYRKIHTVDERTGRGMVNMHEFTTIDEGRRSLMITFNPQFADVTQKDGSIRKMSIGNNGFSEIDTATGLPIFSWWALDHMDASESQVRMPTGHGNADATWDFFHMNSVDKNADGDYLISARYTNTIYKISGKDGSIIWRFGGKYSDFKLDGFNFSSQHDARWRSEDGTTTVITFFNNHSDGESKTANTSAAMEVALNTDSMTATLVNELPRPDGRLTNLRGNVQRLDNGHTFVCWSENTYISEFDETGNLVMQAQMQSHRFSTYRAYKFNFTGTPSEPIALKAFVYGVTPETSTTVYYVSWNGATEVARWKFYTADDGTPTYLGTAKRAGFETMFMSTGASRRVMVEAVDVNGQSLGFSEVSDVELPPTWHYDRPAVESTATSTQSGHSQSADFTMYDQEVDDASSASSPVTSAESEVETASGLTSKLHGLFSTDERTVITTGAFFVGILISAAVVAFLVRSSRRRRQYPEWTKCETPV